MKIEIGNGLVVLSLRCVSWEVGAAKMVGWREYPPDGYRVIWGSIEPRTGTGTGGQAKSGKRCNLTVRFQYCDKRIAPFTAATAQEFFRTQESVAPESSSPAD